MLESSLMDSKAVMPTRRKASNSHRERLSEKTSLGMMQQSALIGNENYEKSAEMTDSHLGGVTIGIRMDTPSGKSSTQIEWSNLYTTSEATL